MLTYIVIIIWIAAALIICANFLLGYFRGLRKSLGSLAAVLLAAVIAFIVSGAICTPDSFIVQRITDAVMTIQGDGEELGALLTGLNGVLSFYLAMLIKPFVFTAFFIVISILLRLIGMLVFNLVPNLSGSRKGMTGALVGILCGVLSVVMVFMPVVGTLDMASNINLKDDSADWKQIEELAFEVRENKSIGIFLSVGCGKLYDSLARVRVNGRTVRIADEITIISDIASSAVKARGIIESDSLNGKGNLAQIFENEDLMDFISEILDSIKKSPVLQEVLAGIISEAAKEWFDADDSAREEMAERAPLLAPIVDCLMEILQSTAGETAVDDLDTIKNVMQIIADSVPKDENGKYIELMGNFSYEETEKKILNALSENERMAPLAKEVDNLLGRAMDIDIVLPEESIQGQKPLVENLSQAIAEQLNKGGQESTEQQIKQIAGVIAEKLEAAGISGVNGDAVEQCAAGLIEQLKKAEKDKINADDVKLAFVLLGLNMPVKK